MQEQLQSDRGDLSVYILVGVVLDASATPSEPTCSSVKPLLTSSGRAPRTFGYILGDPLTSKVHLINHLIKSYQDTISTSSYFTISTNVYLTPLFGTGYYFHLYLLHAAEYIFYC